MINSAVVVCDAHPSPLPVERFARESGVWPVAVRDRVRLRCPWCRTTVWLRGRRLAVILGRSTTVTLRGLAAAPTARARGRVS